MPKIAVLSTSAIVGIVATVVDWLVLVLAVRLGLSEGWAIVPAFLAGVTVQFFGNQRFTFHAHEHIDGSAFSRQVKRFILVECCTLALTAIAYNLLREAAGIDFRIARIIAAFVVYMGFSLPMWHWVFGRAEKQNTPGPTPKS